jgi:hypothetical protein
MPRDRRDDRVRVPASRRASALVACALCAVACSGDPDIVGRKLNGFSVDDAGGLPADAGGRTDDASVPDAARGVRDASPDALDGSVPPPPPIFTGTTDAGMCDFSDALRNAGLGAELWFVALTCRVPLWWFTQGITGIDQREILRILLGETAVPPTGQGSTPDACDMTYGIFYYDDPSNPANVVLCDSVCDALRERLLTESDKIGCTPPPGARRDAG